MVRTHPSFGTTTLKYINGAIHFMANDVGKSLGYSNPNNAVNAHCRFTLTQGIPHPQSVDKTPEVKFITESDVCHLVWKWSGFKIRIQEPYRSFMKT